MFCHLRYLLGYDTVGKIRSSPWRDVPSPRVQKCLVANSPPAAATGDGFVEHRIAAFGIRADANQSRLR